MFFDKVILGYGNYMSDQYFSFKYAASKIISHQINKRQYNTNITTTQSIQGF